MTYFHISLKSVLNEKTLSNWINIHVLCNHFLWYSRSETFIWWIHEQLLSASFYLVNDHCIQLTSTCCTSLPDTTYTFMIYNVTINCLNPWWTAQLTLLAIGSSRAGLKIKLKICIVQISILVAQNFLYHFGIKHAFIISFCFEW